MENIRVLGEELSTADIEDIKAKREAFVKEHVKNMRDLRARGQFSWLDMSTTRYYRCNTCEAVFQADQPDGKYCPACRGSELMEIKLSEMIDQGTTVRSIDLMDAQDETQIRELRSQKLSKRAIAERLGIRIGKVSEVVGIKKRKLSQENIDFIREAYLSGRSDWDIKEDLGRISLERIGDVVSDLCQEIKKAHDQGTRLEDIGKIIGIHGHDQAIIEIANRFIKSEAYLRDIESRCTEPIGEL